MMEYLHTWETSHYIIVRVEKRRGWLGNLFRTAKPSFPSGISIGLCYWWSSVATNPKYQEPLTTLACVPQKRHSFPNPPRHNTSTGLGGLLFITTSARCHEEAWCSQTKQLCCIYNSFFSPKQVVPVVSIYELKTCLLIYRYPNANHAFKLLNWNRSVSYDENSGSKLLLTIRHALIMPTQGI